jgi:hypothetical protein
MRLKSAWISQWLRSIGDKLKVEIVGNNLLRKINVGTNEI